MPMYSERINVAAASWRGRFCSYHHRIERDTSKGMTMAVETTSPTKTGRTRDVLTPVIEADQWYWAEHIRRVFDMSRETVAALKRGAEKGEVKRCRNGDLIVGQAVLRFLKSV